MTICPTSSHPNRLKSFSRSVATRSIAAFDAAAPIELPIETESDLTGGRYVYDAANDGKRFLVIRRTTRNQPQAISVVINWPSLVR